MNTIAKIVTVDGPAGAGKSTVAKKLAQKLNYRYLDTGAMYRTAALLGLRSQFDWNDEKGFADLVRQHKIEVLDGHAFLDGEEVSDQIRTIETTEHTKYAADNVLIRQIMADLQRQTGQGGGIVVEGRDQGSVVFPEAFCKFYLTASPEARARRRIKDLADRHIQADYDDILTSINDRDHRDSSRKVGPLTCPKDAIVVDSSDMNIDDVINVMSADIESKLSAFELK